MIHVTIEKQFTSEWTNLEDACHHAIEAARVRLFDLYEWPAQLAKHEPEQIKNFEVYFNPIHLALTNAHPEKFKEESYTKEKLIKLVDKSQEGSIQVFASLYYYESFCMCISVQIIDSVKAQRWMDTNPDALEIKKYLEECGGGKARFGNGIEMKVKKPKVNRTLRQ